MTLSSFSSENDPLPAPEPAGSGEGDALSPGLEQAITEWRRTVPQVRLAERVVAAWREQAAEAPQAPVGPDRAAEIRTAGAGDSGGAGESGRGLRRGWRWIAAAAVLVVAAWGVWLRSGATLQREGVELAGENQASESQAGADRSVPTVPAGQVAGTDSIRSAVEVGAADASRGNGELAAAEATPVGEFVGDARAAVKELTAEATSAVTDLFAVAWAEPESKRRPERDRRPQAVVGTDAAAGTSAGTEGWEWSITPLGEWSGGLQPVGKAVDYLYERLGDEPVDAEPSADKQTSDTPVRVVFPVMGRTL